ncbi:sugar phosphate isomerase/epimerase family protein [Cerasicoccus maritimus]|uniref:sugar phosphate isomerase/epimerase family protein n=1 Tax=Cerasicoccus maritimus TaxID=490089 RepID=UPI0028529C0D|nr:sugar phosphate isomerase/epimerase family protein [Cerasicoccus maritimus]
MQAHTKKIPENFYRLTGNTTFSAWRQEGDTELKLLLDLGFYGVYPQDLFCTIEANDASGDIIFDSPEEQLFAVKRREVEEFHTAVRAHSLTMDSAHFGQTLPPPNEEVEWILPRHKALVETAAIAGLKRFTTHMGWMYGLTSIQYMGDVASRFNAGELSLVELHRLGREAYGGIGAMVEDSVPIYQSLCDEAAKHGIMVTIETSCIEALEINARSDEIRRFIKKIDRDNLGVCLDPGHCFCQGVDPVSLTRELGSLIVETHFHDNFGDRDAHLPLGAGKIDWPGLLDAMIDIGYSGEITFEQSNHESNQRYWKHLISAQ